MSYGDLMKLPLSGQGLAGADKLSLEQLARLYPRLRAEMNPELPPEGGPDGGDGDEQGENDAAERRQELEDLGQLQLPKACSDIHVVTIIGQIEGHMVMPQQNKATKYEHVIPQLVAVEQSPDIHGLIVILNTVGGDVEAGLALAEIIASLSKPTVSLVLGGGHSIGVPIAVATDRSFIAPTATMTIHPIRLTGMVVGVAQSFDYLQKMQSRITDFVVNHSGIDADRFRQLMLATGELAHDVGTVVVGSEAVECGLIDQVGGLSDALTWLRQRIGPESAPPAPQPPADKRGCGVRKRQRPPQGRGNSRGGEART